MFSVSEALVLYLSNLYSDKKIPSAIASMYSSSSPTSGKIEKFGSLISLDFRADFPAAIRAVSFVSLSGLPSPTKSTFPILGLLTSGNNKLVPIFPVNIFPVSISLRLSSISEPMCLEYFSYSLFSEIPMTKRGAGFFPIFGFSMTISTMRVIGRYQLFYILRNVMSFSYLFATRYEDRNYQKIYLFKLGGMQ